MITAKAYNEMQFLQHIRVDGRGEQGEPGHDGEGGRPGICPIGGDKTGNDRFDEEYAPRADALYDAFSAGLRLEG